MMVFRTDFVPYAPLPHAVLHRTDLSPAAKLVFAALADLPPRKDGRVQASNRRLAELTGLGDSSIRRAQTDLEHKNLIRIDHRRGRRPIYALLVQPCGAPEGAKVVQNERPSVVQDERPGRPNTTTSSVKMNDPLARTVPFTLHSTPEGVAPLIWQHAKTRVRAVYAETFGAGEMPPARWYELLAAELAAGNLGIAGQLTPDAFRAGLKLATDARRPFGFRWIVLAVQQSVVRSAPQARPAIAPRPPAVDARDEARNEDRRRRIAEADAHWATLPADRQAELLAASARQNPWAHRRPDLLRMFAATAAYDQQRMETHV